MSVVDSATLEIDSPKNNRKTKGQTFDNRNSEDFIFLKTIELPRHARGKTLLFMQYICGRKQISPEPKLNSLLQSTAANDRYIDKEVRIQYSKA